MPRDGDTPLARLAHAIVHGNGFALGPPRRSDAGATVTVPILRDRAHPRPYVLAGERADDLSATDTGRIERLRVHNDSGVLVFLPVGSLFAGSKTASRGTTTDVLLAPSEDREVDVKCVEPPRPVVALEPLELDPGLLPANLTQALVIRDQGLVWATVDGIPSADAAARPGHSTVHECGEIVLDAQGVVTAEIYDHPDSWTAAGPRRWEPAEANVLGLDPANAEAVVRRFLEDLASRPARPSGPSSWMALDFSAIVTVLDGSVIHCVAFGRDLTRTNQPATELAAGLWGEEVSTAVLASGSNADADVAAVVASRPSAEVPEGLEAPPLNSPRRRKVLTSGWDAGTFSSLERLSHKEFGGDRSAAIRSLVRRGLREAGYLGPRSTRPVGLTSAPQPEDVAVPGDEDRTHLEARILEYERIAQTETYADWLRKRARLEVDRLTGVRLESHPDVPVAEPQPAPEAEAAEEILDPEEIEPAPPSLPPPPPVDVRPLLRRAFASSAAGRYPEALTSFDEVLTAEPDNRTALLGRAVALRRSGKAQEALDALDAVLQAEPTNAAALLNRGRLLQERGDLPGALEAFDQLSRAAPNDWDVWLVRGDVLAKLGRRAEALHAYAEAQRRNPDDEALTLRIRGLESMESAPAPPPLPRIPLPRDVQEGQSYLVPEGHPNLSLRVLRALAARGVPSLAITVRSPEALRRDIGIAGVRILELSHTPGEGRHDPTALAALSHLIERFIHEGRGHGVVALDGLASMVLENGAREVLLFIERVNEAVLQSHAVFLISVAPGDVSDREIALLERSLRTLS